MLQHINVLLGFLEYEKEKNIADKNRKSGGFGDRTFVWGGG